jgi:hypothetical protein
MQLKWTSSCGYNFNNYLATWDNLVSGGNGSFLHRPPIPAVLENNITVITTLLGSDAVKTESDDSPRIGLYKATSGLPHHVFGFTLTKASQQYHNRHTA